MREYTYGIRGTDDIIHTRYSTYERIKKVDQIKTTGDFYYEKNHEGSIIRITNSTGGILDEYTYTVFGKPYRKNTEGIYKPVTGTNDSPIGNTRLYTGREYDREISLSYHRARYYDPHLGRFISRDPIGTQDNINLYTYVGNSPVGYVDRDGRISKSVLIIKGVETNNKNYGFIKAATKFKKNELNLIGISEDMVQEIDAKNFDNLKSIFDEISRRNIDYSQIIIIAHGTPKSILLGDSDTGYLNKENVSELSMPTEFDTPISLESCETGYGKNSIGELLAKQLGTSVKAPDNFVTVYDGGEIMRVEGYYYGMESDGWKQTIREFLLPDRYFEIGNYNTFNY